VKIPSGSKYLFKINTHYISKIA